jgi:hypothetical protein
MSSRRLTILRLVSLYYVVKSDVSNRLRVSAFIVSDCKQTGHCSGLLHSDFLNSLDATYPIAKGIIDDLNILDV